MAKRESAKPVLIRFPVKATEDVLRRVRHLAVDLNTSAEKLAGMLLTDAIKRAEHDPDSLRDVVPRKREGKG